MIKRWIEEKLKQTIKKVPAVALLGPRQVGKTTLAKNITNVFPSLYLDLEAPSDLIKLNDPESFLSQNANKLIVLDEIQRKPDIFMVLRGLIDKNRQQGKKGAQFLLLGSASMDLLHQSSESLAGRINYIHMSGLNICEVPHKTSRNIQKLWLRGGFPESYLLHSNLESMEWLEMLIRTYLERDVPQAGFRIPAGRLRRLWTMLAHLNGETLNYSKLASNFEIDGKTVKSYIDILADLFLIRRLDPWHGNVKKRLIKSPRFYIRDSGILHRLLGISDYEALLSHPAFGKSWEGFVMENTLSVLSNFVEPYYYRTSFGTEIDLVLKFHKELWAIEIKYGLSPKIKSGFYSSAEDIKATKKFVIYSGNEEFSLEHNVIVISLPRFINKLKEEAL